MATKTTSTVWQARFSATGTSTAHAFSSLNGRQARCGMNFAGSMLTTTTERQCFMCLMRIEHNA
jgi:hypothetical protein